MPFIRYTRDKRGYESTVVLHAYRTNQGVQRGRVLYLFRSPAHVQVGRSALDNEVMEALEHTHPDLTFDWTTLLRDSATARYEARESREPRDTRSARPAPSPRKSQPSRAAPAVPAPATPAIVDDPSPLGRTLGPESAAQFRSRYQELLQRIARRARTPEERDKLNERAGRLNPGEWTDEAAIHAGAASFAQEFEAISAELPQRRRGRRGGRNRHDGRPGGEAVGNSDASDLPADPIDPIDPIDQIDPVDAGGSEL